MSGSWGRGAGIATTRDKRTDTTSKCLKCIGNKDELGCGG
jgi:hypothetical protein